VKRLVGVVLVLAAVGTVALAASANGDDGPRLHLAPSSARAGASIVVSGGGFKRDTFVTLTLTSAGNAGGGAPYGGEDDDDDDDDGPYRGAAKAPIALGSATVDSRGRFSTAITIPTTAPGRYEVSASGISPRGSRRVATARLRVVA
jgi:hypothetical protein